MNIQPLKVTHILVVVWLFLPVDEYVFLPFFHISLFTSSFLLCVCSGASGEGKKKVYFMSASSEKSNNDVLTMQTEVRSPSSLLCWRQTQAGTKGLVTDKQHKSPQWWTSYSLKLSLSLSFAYIWFLQLVYSSIHPSIYLVVRLWKSTRLAVLNQNPFINSFICNCRIDGFLYEL